MIYAIFFLSGISGLMFQHIWFRQAGLVFGNSVWATSLVLSSFMAGLALGNALAAARPTLKRSALQRYAALEAIVAITGLGLVFLLPMLGEGLVPGLVQAVGDGPALGVVRFCLAFALLVIPTAAMGMTLPVLVGRTSSPERFGTTLGQLYGWNTLGAVAGALAGETLFYSWMGIRGTAYVAASVNLVAASLSLLLARTEGPPAPIVPDTPSARWTGDETRLLIVAALAGGSLLALEVIWTRFLLLFLFGTALSFAIMLALTLAGVALGSLIAARVPKLCASPSAIAVLGMLASIAVIGSYTTFGDVLRINLPGIPWMHWTRVVILTSALVFPTSMISGAFFTSVGTALSRTRQASQATGLLTLANTIGAMVGAMVAGFLLLPRLGMEGAFWLIAATYFLAVVVSPGFGTLLRRDRWVTGLAILSLAFVLLFPSGLMNGTYLRGALRPFTVGTTPAKISGFREGLT
ncbi:MAG: spermidine synthase, partial [Vicinamibacteria bacterium]